MVVMVALFEELQRELGIEDWNKTVAEVEKGRSRLWRRPESPPGHQS